MEAIQEYLKEFVSDVHRSLRFYSLLLVIIGAINIASGGNLMGVTQDVIVFESTNLYLDEFNMQAQGRAFLLIGATTVIIGVLGFFSVKHQKLIFLLPLMALTFSLGIALIAISSVVVQKNGDYRSIFEKHACGKLTKETLDPVTFVLNENYNTTF